MKFEERSREYREFIEQYLKSYIDRFSTEPQKVLFDAMGYSLLMIAASPLVGWLGDVGPTAGTGLTALGGLVAAVGMEVLLFKKN